MEDIKIGFWDENIESNSAPERCLRETIKAVNKLDDVKAVHSHKKSTDNLRFESVNSDSAKDFASSENLDVIHWNNNITADIPSRINIPKILTFHGDEQWEVPRHHYGKHPILRSFKEACVDMAKLWQYDAVCFVSENLRHRMISQFGWMLNDTHVTYNAPMSHIEQAFDPSVIKKYDISEPYVFHLSSKGKKKNINGVIDGFKKSDTDCNLVIGGTWDSMEFKDDKIKTTGYIPDEDLKYLYSHAEAFVYPSIHETFGIPPVESLRCGVTPVVSNTYSLPEVTEPHGILADPCDERDIADGIERAIKSDIEPQYRFSWQDTAKHLVRIARELSNR